MRASIVKTDGWLTTPATDVDVGDGLSCDPVCPPEATRDCLAGTHQHRSGAKCMVMVSELSVPTCLVAKTRKEPFLPGY